MIPRLQINRNHKGALSLGSVVQWGAADGHPNEAKPRSWDQKIPALVLGAAEMHERRNLQSPLCFLDTFEVPFVFWIHAQTSSWCVDRASKLQ